MTVVVFDSAGGDGEAGGEVHKRAWQDIGRDAIGTRFSSGSDSELGYSAHTHGREREKTRPWVKDFAESFPHHE